jgi:hypothetical protein
MDKITEKYTEIKALIIRRFIIKISGFLLLIAAGIVLPLAVRTWHLFGRASFGQERPEDVFKVLFIGVGFLGIITSLQYLYNSLKLLKKKMNGNKEKDN